MTLEVVAQTEDGRKVLAYLAGDQYPAQWRSERSESQGGRQGPAGGGYVRHKNQRQLWAATSSSAVNGMPARHLHTSDLNKPAAGPCAGS